jgi:hypothetical protein
MIRGLRDVRKAAKLIVELSSGDCELCGDPIGEKYCAPAQLLPREWKDALSLEVRYQVCCEDCYLAIDAVINSRRALNQ